MTRCVKRVSVIIPAYHSDQTIATCLEALRTQTWQDFETIVVNSSAEERTQQIVNTCFPDIIFHQSTTRLLPHAARNLGVSLAHGELLVFTDPDTVPTPNWLAELVCTVQQGHPVVQGSVKLENSSWLARGIHLCKRFAILSGLHPHMPWVVSTVNACYARRVWQDAGPFRDDLFCADVLLSWRSQALGYPAWFEPKAIVIDRHSETIGELLHERFERGKEFGAVRAEYEHWSRRRAIVYAFAIPLLLFVILWRTFRAARTTGLVCDFFISIPIPILGQLAWLFGESRSFVAYAIPGH